MSKTSLKASIATVVKTNGVRSITGANLRGKLNEIVDEIYPTADATALDGTEVIIVQQGGERVETTTQDIADLGGGGVFIPLAGTDTGVPVTGDIEIEDSNKLIFSENTDYKISLELSPSDGYSRLYSLSKSDNRFGAITTGYQSIQFTVSDLIGDVAGVISIGYDRGLISNYDYTSSITDLDYTQKKYVGYRGTATLVAGTVTVANATIKTGAVIYVSVNTAGGTQGFLSAPTASIVNETSFVINSSSNTETSTVNWWFVNP